MEATRVRCVGAVVRDDRDRILMIRRAQEPGRGRWSIPGGRIEPGESSTDAVVREVLEETGLRVVVTGVAGYVEIPSPDGGVYEVEDYFARVEPGQDPHAVRAATDADAAGWYPLHRLDELPLVDGLVEAFRAWDVVPGQRRRG